MNTICPATCTIVNLYIGSKNYKSPVSMGLNAYIVRVFVQLTDFGLSKVGLISSTDDLSGPTVAGATLMEEITKHHNASVEQPQHRERRQQRSAVGTPDYLAPEILLGTSHGIFSY